MHFQSKPLGILYLWPNNFYSAETSDTEVPFNSTPVFFMITSQVSNRCLFNRFLDFLNNQKLQGAISEEYRT